MSNGEVVFLFGSGISFPTGMFSSKEIEDCLVDGSWIDSNLQYKRSKNTPRLKYQEIISLVRKELHQLKLRSKLLEIKNINYEDIYSTIYQIFYYYDRYPNIVAQPFLESVYRKIILEICPNDRYPGNVLKDTLSFINSAIKDLLTFTKNGEYITKKIIKGFDFFDRMNECGEIKKVTIFSLNHDLLIERYLGDLLYIPIKPMGNDVKKCNIDNKHQSKKFILYKLHGSVDWDVNMADIFHTEFGILTGSCVKENNYYKKVYSQLFDEFHQTLLNTNTIFISGYGWNDNGINGRIINWLESHEENRIVIFARDISPISYIETRKEPPSALWSNWDKWVEEKKIIVIEKWISESCLSDIICYNR